MAKSVAARASSSKLKSKKPNVTEKKTFARKTPSSLKNSQPNSASNSDRQQMIQYAAYHIAEKDGFQSGKEEEYWLLAEQQIAGLFGNVPQKDNSH